MLRSQNLSLKSLVTCIALLSGPLIYLAYWLAQLIPIPTLNLSHSAQDLASVIIGFAFSTLGFLIATLALMLHYSSTHHVQAFKRLGRLDALFSLFKIAVTNLIITGCGALLLFSPTASDWLFDLVMISFANNVIQLAMISITTCNLVRHAAFGSE